MNVTKIYAPPRLWCEFPDEGWFTALRLANRIKPGSVLWLWEKIRKSLYACSQYSVVLPRTAAQVLMCPDGTFKTHTSLRHNINQAYLDFLIFVQQNKTSPGLMQFANRNPPEPPYTRKLISPTNQHLSQQNSVGSILRNNQLQYRNILSVSILAKISPSGRHTMIRIAEANQEADTSSDIMPRL